MSFIRNPARELSRQSSSLWFQRKGRRVANQYWFEGVLHLYTNVMLFKQFLFVLIFGCAGSSLLRRVSSRCRGWGLLSVPVWGLLSVVVSLAVEPGLQGAQTHQLWCTGLAAQHVGPSQTRDRACVSCIGRLILQHWASREAPNVTLECYSYGRKKTLITGRRELFCCVPLPVGCSQADALRY